MEKIRRKLSELKPYEGNAKKHPPEQIEQIKASIRAFGMNDPIGIDENDMVLEGHGRLIALKELGETEADCIQITHLTTEEKKAYIIAHNKTTLNSGYEDSILKAEMEFLKSANFDMDLTGFTPAEMDELFKEDVKDGIQDDDFDEDAAFEAIKVPMSHQGDVWLLGRHRLLCGDSTSLDSFKVLMDGKKANLVVTDPPYNVDYEGAIGKIKNDDMTDEKFRAFLLSAYQGMFESLTDGGGIYVFHSDRETINFRLAFKEVGFFCHQTCIWVKNAPVMGHCDYQYMHEPVLYGWKPTAGHKFYANRSQRTIWNYAKPVKSTLHPTTKPIELIAFPVMNSSLTNGIVLDPFGGSGSTLIACEQSDRVCYMIELDEKFVDVIVKRYIEQVGKTDGVFLLRDGNRTSYADVPKEDAE